AQNADQVLLIHEIWKNVLGRLPDEAELQLAREWLNQATASAGHTPDKAMESFVHTLFMSNAFLYVD
ncbi:MAG: hypothetical protein ACKO0V_11860, partial [bacterium]